MDDMFGGAPKYQSAQDIYDGLEEKEGGEEVGILSEMFSDVSWDNQDYYYSVNNGKLYERWQEITDYGDKMWLMDLAVFQLGENDVNDILFDILYNEDMAKRIGFKKIFADTVLGGVGRFYDAASEAFFRRLEEAGRMDFPTNSKALDEALNEVGLFPPRSPYADLCRALYQKLKGLRLEEEKQLVVESRAHLTAYDDFLYGLKSNQFLYKRQEELFQKKMALLQSNYDKAVAALLGAAKAQGLELALPEPPKEASNEGTSI